MISIANLNWNKRGSWTLLLGAQDAGGLPYGSYYSRMDVEDGIDPLAFTVQYSYPLSHLTRDKVTGKIVDTIQYGVRLFASAKWGGGQNAISEVPWDPRLLADMGDLGQSYDFTFTRTSGNSNVYHGWFLTDDAKGLRTPTTIEVAQHLAPTPALWAFAKLGKWVGEYVDTFGRHWVLYMLPPAVTNKGDPDDGWYYVVALPLNTDGLGKGRSDIGALTRFVAALKNPFTHQPTGIPGAKVWGTDFGVEVVNGAGLLEVRSLTGLA